VALRLQQRLGLRRVPQVAAIASTFELHLRASGCQVLSSRSSVAQRPVRALLDLAVLE
jgi:hypothetical protein